MSREETILDAGKTVQRLSRAHAPGILKRDYWQGKMLDWVMKDPGFKTDLFRFVDVLPSLGSTEQVRQHIKDYFLKEGRDLPAVMSTAVRAASSSLTAGIAAMSIRKNVKDMALKFIIGEEIGAALANITALNKGGIACTVDILGEKTLSEEESEFYYTEYQKTIVALAKESSRWPHSDILGENHLGKIPRANVSIKISTLDSQLKSMAVEDAVTRLKKKVLPLLLLAKEEGVSINIDLEQWDLHEITYRLFEELACHDGLKNWPHLGIVLQAYLLSSKQDFERLLRLAKHRGTPFNVRLVKGAYWDFEVVNSSKKGTPCPVFLKKESSDRSFEDLSERLLENINNLWPAFGSHNLRSLSSALVMADEKGIEKKALEIQMLYGMAEPERKAYQELGYRVRVYAPVGTLLPGMAYLVRRLLENTANSGFLQMSGHLDSDISQLFSKPELEGEDALKLQTHSTNLQFKNEGLLDFTDAEVRAQFSAAIKKWDYTFPIVAKPSQVLEGLKVIQHFSPNVAQQLTTRVVCASLPMTDSAVAKSYQAFKKYRSLDLEVRACRLEKLADLMLRQRYRLAALQCHEVGKPWEDADADVCEAIDFCRYYAGQARKDLGVQKIEGILGENNSIFYEGRGPTAVIAPWNFPLAILCGMTVAALVSGNTVLLKPAEQASGVAQEFYKLLLEAGFSPEEAQFLPGEGETIGSHLVEHPLIAQIIFTGSQEVGLEILQRASITQKAQPQIKRVISEMGGKNAIIIDDDADLDQAISEVIKSAFGFAGQKCSACSRVIIHELIYAPFIARLIEGMKSMTVAPATDPNTSLGPVVDETAQKRLLAQIEEAAKQGKVLYQGKKLEGGWFVPATLIACESSADTYMQNEFFGPLLSVIKVKDFDEALVVACDTAFALTGAVFSRSPSNLQKAQQEFRVGNLYLNQGSTGAFVHRQPFGGFGMSGFSAKAGGPGYLQQFSQARCLTENTTRQGFTPDLEI